LKGNFYDTTRNDNLLHIETDNMYKSKKYDFVFKIVRKAVERHLMKIKTADVVDFFQHHINSGIYGNNLDSLYERIVFVILNFYLKVESLI
jgi:hypothetical protein